MLNFRNHSRTSASADCTRCLNSCFLISVCAASSNSLIMLWFRETRAWSSPWRFLSSQRTSSPLSSSAFFSGLSMMSWAASSWRILTSRVRAWGTCMNLLPPGTPFPGVSTKPFAAVCSNDSSVIGAIMFSSTNAEINRCVSGPNGHTSSAGKFKFSVAFFIMAFKAVSPTLSVLLTFRVDRFLSNAFLPNSCSSCKSSKAHFSL